MGKVPLDLAWGLGHGENKGSFSGMLKNGFPFESVGRFQAMGVSVFGDPPSPKKRKEETIKMMLFPL